MKFSKIKKIGDSKIVWYTISTVVLAALIYLADFEDFITAITRVNLFYMSLAFFFGMSVFLVWGYVWHSFFRELGIETSLKKSYKLFMAGNFMNSVTPLGQLGGEPFMAYIVSENTNSTYEKSLSAIVSSDLLNTIPILVYTLLIFTYIFLFGSVRRFYAETGLLLLALTFIALATGWLLWRGNHHLESYVGSKMEYFASRSKRIKKIYDSGYERIPK
jgi:Predicted integral membrane protein